MSKLQSTGCKIGAFGGRCLENNRINGVNLNGLVSTPVRPRFTNKMRGDILHPLFLSLPLTCQLLECTSYKLLTNLPSLLVMAGLPRLPSLPRVFSCATRSTSLLLQMNSNMGVLFLEKRSPPWPYKFPLLDDDKRTNIEVGQTKQF